MASLNSLNDSARSLRLLEQSPQVLCGVDLVQFFIVFSLHRSQHVLVLLVEHAEFFSGSHGRRSGCVHPDSLSHLVYFSFLLPQPFVVPLLVGSLPDDLRSRLLERRGYCSGEVLSQLLESRLSRSSNLQARLLCLVNSIEDQPIRFACVEQFGGDCRLASSFNFGFQLENYLAMLRADLVDQSSL